MSVGHDAAWHSSQTGSQQQRPPSPPIMSANADGPVDPHEFYSSFSSTSSTAAAAYPARTHALPDHVRSFHNFSRSPERARIQAPAATPPSNPPSLGTGMLMNHTLSSTRSQPVLSPRQPSAAHDLPAAFDTRGDGQAAPIRTPNERYRRPLPPPKGTSPRLEHARLAKRNPPQSLGSAVTSFDSNGSSNHTRTSESSFIANDAALPPMRVQPAERVRPLFGELSPDGMWNGHLDMHQYMPVPDNHTVNRRSSDGNIALPTHRPRSQYDFLQPDFLVHHDRGLGHKRSRSDLSAMRSYDAPALSQLVMQTFPFIQQATTPSAPPPPPPPAQTQQQKQSSRIPVPPRKSSGTQLPTMRSPSRPASALANPHHGSSVPRSTAVNENHKPQNTRYIPPKVPHVTQLLSAKVVTPVPKVSPPLRSSRPRQPVSSATTAASRARAANTQQQQSPASPTPRTKPSEQWLGKPYDAKQEKSRRKIHEIGKIDFAERRARIQKAISRNLEESASVEHLRAQLAAEAEAKDMPAAPAGVGTGSGTNVVDQHQAKILDAESQALGLVDNKTHTSPRKSLTVDTANLPAPVLGESQLHTADTEVTEFEIGTTPNSAYEYGDSAARTQAQQDDAGLLLSATTYVPPVRRKASPAPPPLEPAIVPEIAEVASAESSPSDIEDRWGLKRGVDNTGSIRIMLDDNPSLLRLGQPQRDGVSSDMPPPVMQVQPEESPVVPQIFQNPQPNVVNMDQPFARADVYQAATQDAEFTESPVVAQAIDHFRSTGLIAPDLLADIPRHSLDLHRLSANGGSDAAVVKSLLESIKAQGLWKDPSPVTPHTPPGALDVSGTAIVYNHAGNVEATPDRRSDDAVLGSDDEDDFALQIRRADEAWERQLRGEGPMFPDVEPFRPQPPPKDEHYTPHSSIGPDNSNIEAQWNSEGYRGSFTDSARNASSKNVDSVISEDAVIPARVLTPSLPLHAPPPPPVTVQDTGAGASIEGERFSAQSPRLLDIASGSERPSVDSQRQDLSHPASQSASSLAGSAGAGIDQSGRHAAGTSPDPEQKRLNRRKNIIRELLDTENTYHQDLKIIEDIYKATVEDFVSHEDRKTLFGNCDEIERFSLSFYDQLRKAAASIYMPSKNGRWGNRRGSMSTTQSDGQTSVNSSYNPDDGRDKSTTIGKVFLDNLLHMEQLYGAYLRNHDAANQRLSVLQEVATVKFWLEECHKNASDITSAWDLDSLLVKPTQRVSKYPLILQQLLEVTPTDHPDYENLKAAAPDSVAMLTRINEAKKRADIVEQMIGGKRKETDVRSGLAKAFGRRTERLKERVGINEAFQDPEFDALAQRFGGKYIRLQITMRDFQDYVNQVEKAIQSTNNYSTALELFTDVRQSSLPEIESKWRRYGQIVRELTAVSLSMHKVAVQNRVITPLIALIKLHENPQRAINKRKKHIVDYAKCKSIEKRGERPDKKTIEASEMYEALNDQLKIELPKLYELTGKLVVTCLECFVESQMEWQQAFERKLIPLLDAKDVPKTIQEITPAFNADFDFVKTKLIELGICNGSILADNPNNLSSTTTLDGDGRRSSTQDSRQISGSSSAHTPGNRHSRTIGSDSLPAIETPSLPPAEMRVRSNSSMSHSNTGMTPVTPIAMLTAANRPWSNSVTSPPSSGYPSRPSTATAQHASFASSVRSSSDQVWDSRHDSSATYVTAQSSDNHRFSGIFSSAMPPSDSQDAIQGARPMSPTPMTTATEDARILFTCASLYEFRIDKTRKEAGYSYHTYETGAIFDVIAQKGELWLAINQDDRTRTLGWIWEQHFVILTDHNTEGFE